MFGDIIIFSLHFILLIVLFYFIVQIGQKLQNNIWWVKWEGLKKWTLIDLHIVIKYKQPGKHMTKSRDHMLSVAWSVAQFIKC